MNEKPQQCLAIGQEILVTGHDKKQHKAKITQIISATGVRAESLDGKNTAVCEYSETGEVNTFSFPSPVTASTGKEKK